MPDRRTFLSSVTATVAAAASSSPASAAATPAPVVTASPAPNAASRAQALAMRAFDPHLTDAQIETIAHGIETAAASGATLNPHGTLLHNSDEPVTRFHVEGAP